MSTSIKRILFPFKQLEIVNVFPVFIFRYYSTFIYLILTVLLIHFHDFSYLILDSEFQYVLSRRGKPQLLYQGYLFNSDAIKNGRVYWRCVETRRSTCAARLLTIQDKLIEKQPIHDHQPNSYRVDGKRFISYESCNDYFTTSEKQVIAKQSAEVSYEYLETDE